MMKIFFNSLILNCKLSKEIIDLTHQISFFHGKVSSGKSSIARLIDFSFGGYLERTPAITQELVSVTLDLFIGEYNVIIERDAQSSNQAKVSWKRKGMLGYVVAPITPDTAPILGDSIYSLSDLIFYLLGLRPIKTSINSNYEDASLVRLSIRNFLWYCYLDQSHLDSSFYRLEDTNKARSSKEVMKYTFQYSTNKMYELDAELVAAKDERIAKIATVEGLRNFLNKFGIDSVDEIGKNIANTEAKLESVLKERKKLEEGYIEGTHMSDTTRSQVKTIGYNISQSEDAIRNLEERIGEQEALRAELISATFKLARATTVSNVLSGVVFESCPSCGTDIKERPIIPDDHCNLCRSHIKSKKEDSVENAEIVRIDLDSRIKDLEDSLDLHRKYLKKEKVQLERFILKKQELDSLLVEELRNYESVFLGTVREVDRKVATYRERLKSQKTLQTMPLEMEKLEKKIDELQVQEQGLRRAIAAERNSLEKSEEYVRDLEETFLNNLLTVGLPGIDDDDKVEINRITWDVSIWPHGKKEFKYNFFNAGSGGKKTMFNVCYLLAVHTVAAKNSLPLPSFIMIDTPMKNIDKEVNEDLFKRFYDHLYSLASSVLDKTQFIIIDNSYVIPKDDKISFFDRYMTNDDEEFPPLISYYRGA